MPDPTTLPEISQEAAREMLAALTIEAATTALRDAEDEVWRIQMADNFAMVNGTYAAALRVVARCQRDLADAELNEAMSDPAYRLATQREGARA